MASFTVLVKKSVYFKARKLWMQLINGIVQTCRLCELQSHLGLRTISGFQLALGWIEAVIEIELTSEGVRLNIFHLGSFNFRAIVNCSVQN